MSWILCILAYTLPPERTTKPGVRGHYGGSRTPYRHGRLPPRGGASQSRISRGRMRFAASTCDGAGKGQWRGCGFPDRERQHTAGGGDFALGQEKDRKSTRLNSSHT